MRLNLEDKSLGERDSNYRQTWLHIKLLSPLAKGPGSRVKNRWGGLRQTDRLRHWRNRCQGSEAGLTIDDILALDYVFAVCLQVGGFDGHAPGVSLKVLALLL